MCVVQVEVYMEDARLKVALGLFQHVVACPAKCSAVIDRFQTFVWDIDDERPEDEAVWQILHDLAIDLDYYVDEPPTPDYYGDERLKEVVADAVRELRRLGVDVGQRPGGEGT